ncbi:unnamed protein product [Rotaria sordida]|uniref:Uncharacterized protein n=1 Tax=Rotaria sordida TaxID=392033 RepID=A0A814HZU7_9BILA|nr:unnamed protein product [Rotaria sordida]CAF1017706.1 unnamed protein product [Rotaria sordida]CAF1046430.1 unnamed protein product [Rotaria sordida]CAF1196898.1 unnamed protein product [Rotaria sordida]CAF1207733.1 unnamed protein product [Rotaria sordida]
MHALIYSVVFLFVHLLCVPATSIEDVKPVSKAARKNPVALPSYSKLLTLLKNRETKFYENDDDDDDNSSDQNDDDISRQRKQLTSANRLFFLFPIQRATRRSRPLYTYGQKSHWDTFFG